MKSSKIKFKSTSINLSIVFFMVIAIKPISAEDFNAEISIISEFNESSKTFRNTTDLAYTPQEPYYYFDTKAAISETNNMIHIDVTGYLRSIKYMDVLLKFYKGTGNPHDPPLPYYTYTPLDLSNSTPNGCDVIVERTVIIPDWIEVTIRDDDGESPLSTWLRYQEVVDLMPPVFTPDNDAGNLWSMEGVVFVNHLYLTYKSTDNLYLWLINDEGDVFVQSDELSSDAAFSIDFDDNKGLSAIRFTDAAGSGKMKADDWIGCFEAVDIVNAELKTSLGDDNSNILTNYEAEDDEYSILVPLYDGLDSTKLEDGIAQVYYDGMAIGITSVTIGDHIPAHNTDADTVEWAVAVLDKGDFPVKVGDDMTSNWSVDNSKVVMVFNDDVNTIVAGADDGVGPKLLYAYVKTDSPEQIIFKFSEYIDADAINKDKTEKDLYINAPGMKVTDIEVNSADAREIIVTMNKAVPSSTRVNVTSDGEGGTIYAESIMDENGNPAYEAQSNFVIAIERMIEKVSVTNIDRDAGITTLEIVFDKSMIGADVKDPNSYAIEVVPGLKENKDIEVVSIIKDGGIVYTENDDIYKVTIEIDGIIESTAAIDLPKVSIRKDIFGGDPMSPLREKDKAAHKPEDSVGPYLKSASFSYNPEVGKTVGDCIEEDAITLTFRFSEEIDNPDYIDSDTFTAIGGWSTIIIDAKDISAREKISDGVWEIVITLDDRRIISEAYLPYTSPKFEENPYISIAFADDIKDMENNKASDTDYKIPITDETPLWIIRALTADDAGARGFVDHLFVEFGKNMRITENKFDKEDKVIAIDGDPNIIEDVTQLNAATLKITLNDDDRHKVPQSPVVSFALDEKTVIQDDTNGALDMITDFSLTAEDGINPVLINARETDTPNLFTIPAFFLCSERIGSTTYYEYVVILNFSEPMDPNIWIEPFKAYPYFESTIDPHIEIRSFFTRFTYSQGGCQMYHVNCGGNIIGVIIVTDEKLGDQNNHHSIKFHQEHRFYDLSGNDTPVRELFLEYKSYLPCSPMFDNNMLIYGSVYKGYNDNKSILRSGMVYAFRRDDLFQIDPNGNNGRFIIDPNRNLGSSFIHPDNRYYLEAPQGVIRREYNSRQQSYEFVTLKHGFKIGDPLILVVCENPEAPEPHYEIATTACLTNKRYSIEFDMASLCERDLYLGEREIINLHPGWNLISTSISGTYIDYSLCNRLGIDPDMYSGYMYSPDDDLYGRGSLPSEDEIYALDNKNDISSVFFTLSHEYFFCNYFYDPATFPFFPVLDALADGINETPVFCTGRGYYIYIGDVNCPPGIDNHKWQIVLFGKKVPSQEYKLRLDRNFDLIGHWGGLLYYNPDESKEIIRMIKELLPIPNYRDDVVMDNKNYNIFTIVDMDGEPQNISSISTYYNYGHVIFNSTACWYADLVDYSNLSFIAPGGGYWIIINANTESGPFFVNYMD